MNILILSWRGPGHPLSGGAEQVIWKYANHWKKNGHDITLVTSSYTGAIPNEVLSGISIIRKADQYFGVKIWTFFWYLFFPHPKFDLVIDEFHGIPFFTPLYVRTKKLGLIHELARDVWALNPLPKPFNLIPAIIGKYTEPWIFKLLYIKTPFLTVSVSTQSDLKSLGVQDVTVINNGVTVPSTIKHYPKEKEFTLIFLSALAEDKGVEDAIRAFMIVKNNIPNTKLWIVGNGSKSYIEKLKSISTNPIYFGYVTDEKKFELLSRSHVLIFPSVHEGWGLVTVEAGHVGVPTVAYNVAGVRDSVRHGNTGLLVKRYDIQGLATACQKLAKDKKLYSKLSQGSKKWSNNFSWTKSTSQSLKFITKLVYETN